MKAIPTRYNGVNFRSRLEASVAAHFDKILIPWNYEPEGFQLTNGAWYLPDFYLPTARAWVEVKGPHNERMDKFHQFGDDLWGESTARDAYDPEAPMALLINAPTRSGWWDGHARLGMISYRSGSAGFAKCDQCGAVTVISFFQPKCRNCRMAQTAQGEVFNGWDSWMYYCQIPFDYLRPKAKSA